jgi:large subunit ribosomal protein L14
MIQIGTKLNVVDNTGAKTAQCLKILKMGYKQRYASIGNSILVTIKALKKTKAETKVQKSELHTAVIIRVKKFQYLNVSNYKKFYENSVVLLTKQNKAIGSRVFGSVPRIFRTSKFMKIVTLSAGSLI